MSVRAAARELSLVLLGDFNPAILHPQWFAMQGLIKTAEAADADIEIVHKEAAIWQLDWLRVSATTSKLQLLTEKEPFFQPMRDLLVGMLTFLAHTPVSALGVNWGGYFQMTDGKAYSKFGDQLVPKGPWANVLRDPVTTRVHMRSARDDNLSGNINTFVEGHNRFPFCVHVSINDHVSLEHASEAPTAERVISILNQVWDKSFERTESLAESLFEGF